MVNPQGLDWRVQITHVFVDALIVLGAFVLLGIRAVDAAIAIAIVAPLVGARASMHLRPNGAGSAGGSVGGAVALAIGIGAIGARIFASSRGIAVLALTVISAAVLVHCAAAQQVLKLAADQCVSVQDRTEPLVQEIITCASEIVATRHELAYRRSAMAAASTIAPPLQAEAERAKGGKR